MVEPTGTTVSAARICALNVVELELFVEGPKPTIAVFAVVGSQLLPL